MLKMENEFVNNYEICVMAMMRSGHHAIMNWIAANFKEVCFLNWINRNNTSTPFKDCSQDKSEKIISNRVHLDKDQPKECLMYNLENYDPNNIYTDKYYTDRETIFGKSKNYRRILITRDWKNNYASLKKKNIDFDYDLWLKQYFFFDETVIHIEFDFWFKNPAYRKVIAKRIFGSSYNFHKMENIKNMQNDAGQGSSFGDKKPSYKLLYRYKEYQDTQEYNNIKTIMLRNGIE